MKRKNGDVQIYLSRHVKAQNLGINDIEIIDKGNSFLHCSRTPETYIRCDRRID